MYVYIFSLARIYVHVAGSWRVPSMAYAVISFVSLASFTSNQVLYIRHQSEYGKLHKTRRNEGLWYGDDVWTYYRWVQYQIYMYEVAAQGHFRTFVFNAQIFLWKIHEWRMEWVFILEM